MKFNSIIFNSEQFTAWLQIPSSWCSSTLWRRQMGGRRRIQYRSSSSRQWLGSDKFCRRLCSRSCTAGLTHCRHSTCLVLRCLLDNSERTFETRDRVWPNRKTPGTCRLGSTWVELSTVCWFEAQHHSDHTRPLRNNLWKGCHEEYKRERPFVLGYNWFMISHDQ